MAYKVNDNNIIFDSDGKTVLVTNSEILFDGTNTVGNTLYDLSDTHFIDLFKFPAQGTESGYRSAGRSPALANNINTIDKYPFSTDANATDVGDLTQSRQLPAGQSSNTHGYTSGGLRGSPPFSPPYNSSVIDKFSFATDGNATNVGNLTKNTYYCTGVSSAYHGYTAGGRSTPPPSPFTNDIIEKFPFAYDASSRDVGDLATQMPGGGQNGTMNAEGGYINGCTDAPGTLDIIQKFPFATDANAVQVGSLTSAMSYTAGSSSTSHGYASGGSPGISNETIQKYGFISEGNATDVGDLTEPRQEAAGCASTENGYTAGGQYTTPTSRNYIDNFPFSSDANASDVGDLTEATHACAGQQA